MAACRREPCAHDCCSACALLLLLLLITSFLSVTRQVLDGSAELLRKIWDTAKVNELEKKATQYGHAGRINSVAWGRDDRVIATGGEDGLVIVWAFECAATCDGGVRLEEAMTLVGHDAR